MGQGRYNKLLYFLGFVILMLISCWATGESLRLLQPSFPGIIWYVLSIMIFFGASIGLKWACDSFNKDVYVENRRAKLVGSAILFLICWGVSMPTNTHTFFYRSFVDSKVSSDITMTTGYLAQIKNDHAITTLIQHKQTELENQVQTKMGELEAEIMNDANPGFGPKSKEILAGFATLLGVPKIDPLTYKGNNISINDRQTLCNAYRQKIYKLMESRKENIKNALTPKNKEYRKVAELDFKNLELCRKYIQDGTIDLNNPKDVKTVCDQLDRGYATIRNYQDYVIFRNEIDKERYLQQNPQTEVRRLLSVYDVWKDFLDGAYPGSFWFWIFVSALVDILGFIFFVRANKTEDF